MAVRPTNDEDLRAEINITPLVDVVLVLLVVFMVVTPLLKQDVPVDLPVAEHSRTAPDASQVTVSLAADGRALVDGTEVARDELVAYLTNLYEGRPEKTIFLEADRSLTHGQIVDVMDDCRAAGVIQIGVVTKKARPTTPTAPANGTEPAVPEARAADGS